MQINLWLFARLPLSRATPYSSLLSLGFSLHRSCGYLYPIQVYYLVQRRRLSSQQPPASTPDVPTRLHSTLSVYLAPSFQPPRILSGWSEVEYFVWKSVIFYDLIRLSRSKIVEGLDEARPFTLKPWTGWGWENRRGKSLIFGEILWYAVEVFPMKV